MRKVVTSFMKQNMLKPTSLRRSNTFVSQPLLAKRSGLLKNLAGATLVSLCTLGCNGPIGDDVHEAFNDCEELDLEIDENFKEQALVDCTARNDTGYTRGTSFPISVVTIDDKPVERDTANAYYVMQQAAAADGVTLRIVSGFRTNAQQRYLYNCYINRNCNNGNLAAFPGYSNHQSGSALDLNTRGAGVYNWLNRNGARFGFIRTVPSERWHWEWRGGGPGGGICGNQDCTGEDGFSVGQNGTTFEEDDSCTTLQGPSQYWRSESGGSDGSYAWTGAIAGSNSSNYAQWELAFEQAGRYRVEAFIPNSTRPSRQARYSIVHGTDVSEVVIDQSTQQGWVSLGAFDFTQSFGQSVRVNDNTGERSSTGRRVLVDALRVVPNNAPVTPPDDEEPVTPEEPPAQDPAQCELMDEGGIIDEEQDCVELGGPAQYLRAETGSGNSGGYLWTGATASSRTYNYAAWTIPLSQPGRFLIEASAPAGATSRQADYVVTHAQGAERFIIDQRQGGFVELGILRLDSNHNLVTLGDNTGERSSLGRRLAFDALRITPASEVACSEATTTAALNVRPRPNTTRAPIGQLRDNEVFERISTVTGLQVGATNNWYRISFAGQTGYVSAQFAECNP